MKVVWRQSIVAQAEDTALLGSNRSADLGAKTEGSSPSVHGPLRFFPVPFGIGIQAKNPAAGYREPSRRRRFPLTNSTQPKFQFPLNQDNKNMIGDLAYDGPRNLLISTSSTETIVWDLRTWSEAARTRGSTFIAYHPGSGLMATAFTKSEKTCVLSRVVIGELNQ